MQRNSSREMFLSTRAGLAIIELRQGTKPQTHTLEVTACQKRLMRIERVQTLVPDPTSRKHVEPTLLSVPPSMNQREMNRRL
jgi:hypothetical protein